MGEYMRLYDTSIEEAGGRLFQSCSNIGRHRYNPVQKENEIYIYKNLLTGNISALYL